MTILRRIAPIGSVVLAAALVVLGLLGWWMTYDIHHDDAAGNTAVTDAKTTAQVQSSVSQALGRVLTYDYKDPQTTQTAADELLAGGARTQYKTLFASLQKRAPGQQLTLTAQVQAIGVKQLHGRKAELLVFLDQSSKRAADNQSSVSAAQLSVKAEKLDGRWKITALKPL